MHPAFCAPKLAKVNFIIKKDCLIYKMQYVCLTFL